MQSQNLDKTFYEIKDSETSDMKQKNRISWQKELKKQICHDLTKEKKQRERASQKDDLMERRFHDNKFTDKKSQATFIKFYNNLAFFALLTKEV